MKIIEEQFNARFARDHIVLPPEDIAQRKSGAIVKGGWTIEYLFGADEKGEYLDYYARHKMSWGADHCRLYESGEKQELPTTMDVHLVTGNPVADTKEEQAFLKRNQGIFKPLSG